MYVSIRGYRKPCPISRRSPNFLLVGHFSL
nr:MAG TPA: hypothetical protein [Caudoviricetes sp.]